MLVRASYLLVLVMAAPSSQLAGGSEEVDVGVCAVTAVLVGGLKKLMLMGRCKS